MKDSNMPRADFVASIVLIVFGVAVVWASLAMPRFEDQGGSLYDAPGMVPGIIGVLVVALSGVMLVRSIRKKGYMLSLEGRTLGSVLKSEGTVRVLATIGICVLYGLVLLRFLHFIASTLIFVFGFILVFEWERGKSMHDQWKKILFAAVTSIAATGAVYATFRYGFLVNLP